VFFTGEGAEEAVEHAPGVSEGVIERHEEAARLALISIGVGGGFALAALLSLKWLLVARVLKPLVLVLTITSGGLMAQTAHLGGQIRHTEIRNGMATQTNTEGENETGKDNGQEQQEDHDKN
jgi:glucan phosphoethanolaminetransferase (alkaline phosphatase superfamily)